MSFTKPSKFKISNAGMKSSKSVSEPVIKQVTTTNALKIVVKSAYKDFETLLSKKKLQQNEEDFAYINNAMEIFERKTVDKLEKKMTKREQRAYDTLRIIYSDVENSVGFNDYVNTLEKINAIFDSPVFDKWYVSMNKTQQELFDTKVKALDDQGTEIQDISEHYFSIIETNMKRRS